MKTILIIAQKTQSRELFKEVLEGEHRVLEAESHAEAMDLASTLRPDLILLDMQMDDANGAEVCASLKEDAATKYIPLILLSAHDQKQDIISSLNAGAEDYMTCPVNPSELLARIDTHLRTRDYYIDLDKSDLLMLLELSEVISVTRNPKRILTIIVEKMMQAIDVSRCSIIGLDDDGEPVVKVSSDLPKDQEIRLDITKYPEIEQALSTQRPVVLQDVTNHPLMAPVRDKIRKLKDNAIFVVPIIKKQNVIGTFFLRTSSPLRNGITDRVFKLCQVVANISGNALENAVLFESMHSAKVLLEDMAQRDSLTRLYNHQQFHARFEEEFARAIRYDLSLSCLFIDLDDFKVINDKFGHIIGDVVLKKIGNILRQSLRKSDVAARYGGEEFALLLPNTSAEGALIFAERLQIAIRELAIPQLNGHRVTCSIGLATYNNNGIYSYDELLNAADKAMYQAKNAGKDRIWQAE